MSESPFVGAYINQGNDMLYMLLLIDLYFFARWWLQPELLLGQKGELQGPPPKTTKEATFWWTVSLKNLIRQFVQYMSGWFNHLFATCKAY